MFKFEQLSKILLNLILLKLLNPYELQMNKQLMTLNLTAIISLKRLGFFE